MGGGFCCHDYENSWVCRSCGYEISLENQKKIKLVTLQLAAGCGTCQYQGFNGVQGTPCRNGRIKMPRADCPGYSPRPDFGVVVGVE